MTENHHIKGCSKSRATRQTTSEEGSVFCLTCAVLEIAPLLPRQAPIKDFIHQNLLQVFIDKPFEEALVYAASLFNARSYMELEYYREKFFEGSISEACLAQAIEKNHPQITSKDRAVVRHALFYFTEIIDRKAFDFIMAQKGISSKQYSSVEKIIARVIPPTNTITTPLYRALNEKLGCHIDHFVNPILFRLIESYIDQGVSLWQLLESYGSFLSAIQSLAKRSVCPIAYFIRNHELLSWLKLKPEIGTPKLLGKIFNSPKFYAAYVKESLLYHPGWSGMVNIISQDHDVLANPRFITLEELFAVKTALEWQFITYKNPHFRPIGEPEIQKAYTETSPQNDRLSMSLMHFLCLLPDDIELPDDKVLQAINPTALQQIWQDALELTYYSSVRHTLMSPIDGDTPLKQQHKFDAILCIDDREFAFGQYLENESCDIKTYGFPGFFNIDCYFLPHKNDLLEKMCPPHINPEHVVMEQAHKDKIISKHNRLISLAAFISRHGANSIFFGFVSAYTLGHLSLFQLLLSFFHPFKLIKSKQLSIKEEQTSLLFERKDDDDRYRDMFLGYSYEEMATRVFNALQSMGFIENFAPVVFIIGHGSSSVNNPHFAAYDCAACSSHPGTTNARIFAKMANLPIVRELVKKRGLCIPSDTYFVAGCHDTCTDQVRFFDLDNLTKKHAALVHEFSEHVFNASAKNAYERCQKFALISQRISKENALLEVGYRARALFEPRPELGHANVSLCFIGRKQHIYKKNFNRRAFFQSYDPTIDHDGRILAAVLSSAIPVCGGVNLDYFFSRLDPAIYGCGTKLSHNVCGLIGVGNGLDDDLRTGLPIQMTELHEPIRLLIVVEQTPEIILDAIWSDPELIPWVENRWVHIACLDSRSQKFVFFDPKARQFVQEIQCSR